MSSTQDRERRAWPVERLEIREAEGQRPAIRGYAAMFGQLSLDLGGFRERIAPGAFARSVADNDVRALWDHNSQYVLGRNRAGTLTLEEDERGLSIEAEPPATTWAADLLTSMRRGDINQMSFGFFVRDEEWVEEDGILIRILRDVDLFDVSVVTYPAYPQTSAEARARAGEMTANSTARTPIEEGERARARARRAARQREIEILNEVMR